MHPQFVADVMRPLKVEEIMDQEVQNLSGGELQRLAMALCLGKPADVYLIDEPRHLFLHSSDGAGFGRMMADFHVERGYARETGRRTDSI